MNSGSGREEDGASVAVGPTCGQLGGDERGCTGRAPFWGRIAELFYKMKRKRAPNGSGGGLAANGGSDAHRKLLRAKPRAISRGQEY